MIDQRVPLPPGAEAAGTDAAGVRHGRIRGNDALPLPVDGTPHGAGGGETSPADPLGIAAGDDAESAAIGIVGMGARTEIARGSEIATETGIAPVEVADETNPGVSPRANLGVREESREGALPSWPWHP